MSSTVYCLTLPFFWSLVNLSHLSFLVTCFVCSYYLHFYAWLSSYAPLVSCPAYQVLSSPALFPAVLFSPHWVVLLVFVLFYCKIKPIETLRLSPRLIPYPKLNLSFIFLEAPNCSPSAEQLVLLQERLAEWIIELQTCCQPQLQLHCKRHKLLSNNLWNCRKQERFSLCTVCVLLKGTIWIHF